MNDLENEIFGEKTVELLKKHYKKINNLKSSNVQDFIDKYETQLKEISPKRNWKMWLLKQKKIFSK